MKVNIKRGNNNDPLDGAKRKLANIPLPPAPFMLTEQIVLQKPENGGQQDCMPLMFRPLSDFPELLKTDEYIDDERTKVLSDLTAFHFVATDYQELTKLLINPSGNSNQGLGVSIAASA